MRINSVVTSLFLGISLLCSVAGNAIAGDNIQSFIEFSGEIVDQNALAVSGVLPLEFRIYSAENSKKAIATETHFVSVVDGKYTISLGDETPLTSSASELYVAVLLDGKELVRQKVSPKRQTVPSKVEGKDVQTKYVKFSDTDDSDFSLSCPKGYVVTGIEGRRVNGQLDTIRLICSNTF